MADPNPTVDELFKAKAVTNEQVSTLLDAMLAGKLDKRAELAEGYMLDLAAAVKANAFATAVLRDRTSMPGARPNAALSCWRGRGRCERAGSRARGSQRAKAP